MFQPGYYPNLDNAAGAFKTVRAVIEPQRHTNKIYGYEHNMPIRTPSKSG